MPERHAGGVACFYSDPSHYRRLYLSFSLMAYHVPQRYLGALLAAAHSAQDAAAAAEGVAAGELGRGISSTGTGTSGTGAWAAAGRTAGGEMAGEVTAEQFAVRFEHVGK